MTPLDHETDEPVGSATPTGPVNAKSLLSHLKERHDTIQQAQVLDLRVPRWSNPEIWVRYQPVSFDAVDKARTTSGKLAPNDPKTSQIVFLAQIDALIEACVCVYAKLPDADPDAQFSLRPDDPEGPFTKFDPDLAMNLGMNSQSTARQVVRALFFTDGDIVNHSNRVAKWSGWAGDEADTELGES